jgi:ATP-dependent RNA helicase DDX56/DBP9
LAEQVQQQLLQLLMYCGQTICSINLSTDIAPSLIKPLLIEKRPEIIVSTPSKIVAELEANTLTLKESLHTLVIDEADLVLSFGYDEDLHKIMSYLPKIYQALLMSATLTTVWTMSFCIFISQSEYLC